MTARNFHIDTYLAPLSPKERRVVERVHYSGAKGFPTPLDWIVVEFSMAQPSVRTMMSRIRRKLAGTGWTITRNEGGPATATATYKVVPE